MFIQLKKEEKDDMIERIKVFFAEERGEEIGLIAAETVYAFILEEAGPALYNRGIRDAAKLINEKMINLDEDLAALERPVKRG